MSGPVGPVRHGDHMNAPYLGCAAGHHWACPARNTSTTACGCPCHGYDLGYAFNFEGVFPTQLAAIGVRS